MNAQDSSIYSIALPDDLIALLITRSNTDDVSTAETIRRALTEYLIK